MKIKNLASAVIGKLTGGTYFPITDGTTTYKVDYDMLAKAIIENYTGSTIGGTAQTLAAAIGPNVTGRLGMLSNVNLDDMHTDATCGLYWLNCGDTGITGTKPAESGQGLLLVKRQDSTYYRQVYISVTGTTATSAFRWYKTDAARWDTWQTASLQTSLDNKLDLYTGTKIASNTDLNTLTTPGTYFCVNTATAATLLNSPLSTVGFRLEVSRNGYNSDNYLIQTMQAVSTSVVFTYKRGMSIMGTWGAWERINAGETEYTSLACSYGTLTYKCYKTGRIVSLIATIDVTSNIPANSDVITGLPFTGQTANYTPIRAFNNTAATYIDLDVHRSGSSACALSTRTAIASGASIRINATYTTE